MNLQRAIMQKNRATPVNQSGPILQEARFVASATR